MEKDGSNRKTRDGLLQACYKDGDYDGNAYGRSHYKYGHYSHRIQMSIGNFSSRTKHFDHIPYDDCYENSSYDVHKGYHEHGDHFTFINSLGTYLERRYFIEFNSLSCAIPRDDDYDFNIANGISYVLRVEVRRSMEKVLGPILEDLSISLSLNPSSLCYEDDISLVELNIVGFTLEFDRNSLQHVCTITSMRGRRHTMEFEGEGKNVGGKTNLML
ncbi:hypothetical protein M9H77_30711 [Catharanthus roseus]|uniref:Uncharacterized protein n=1 Tax=Catharanthus roseus TaxID=4058 RepID=A0ACB9ZYV7_CATRO|nr:hypothetical protein M9H77_30711 [Catharanthus roseus]